MPVGLFGLYSQISADSTGIVPVLLLTTITLGIPIVAFVLYLVDRSRENGYVSVWGYRQ